MGAQFREMLTWSRTRKQLASLLVVVTLGVGILIGTVVSGHVGASRASFEGSAKTLVIPDPVVMSNTFSGIVTKLEPAVVNISTIGIVQQRPRTRRAPAPIPNPQVRPHDDNPPDGRNNNNDPNGLQDFFDRFFDNPDQPEQEDPERSLGSGIIVDPKGYILTNNHVVEQASRIQVELSGDPVKHDAKLIGVDTETDLAVIKIEIGHDLPTAKLGNSDGVHVGDWVLAIGSPFGLSSTVTAGIISARDRDRSQTTGSQFQHFLQTDAAINPGNSGGPLVDMAGQVIGINTAIMTGVRSMGNEGVGFALPSNAAINVYNQIVTKGHVTRGSIGITFSEVDSDNPVVLRSKGADYGVIVGSVEKDGPAAKAGLRTEDVITKINGKPIHNGNELVDPISSTAVGDKIELTYVRDKATHTVSVTVGDRSKIFPEDAQQEEEAPSAPAPSQYGIHIEGLSADDAHQLGLDPKTPGVIVSHVDPATFGEDIGFQRGYVIVAVNGQPVSSVEDYRKAISTLKPGQDVVFKVIEGGGAPITRLLGGVVPASQ